MLRKIACGEVKLGMYIRGFGGGWFRHPFWRARFLLETDEDVERVRRSGVPYVLIDDEKGLPPEAEARKPVAERPRPVPMVPRRREVPGLSAPSEDRRAADRRAAAALVSRSTKVMKRVFESARLGRAVRLPEVSPIVDDITASVSNNAQILLSAIRKKDSGEYTYFHSVAVCTLMVNVARFLRMSEAEVADMGMSGLLHDIGKMGVPDEVLNKPGRLTDAEYETMRAHPGHGHAMLVEIPGMVPMALDVCLHHHEKMDGTGYPDALPKARIGKAARLGAICDVYDALTSDRVYKQGWQPQEAIAAMWGWEGHFDPDLLFPFMQSIGVFPAGMLVGLRSNRLAIVLDNSRRASRLRAIAFYSTRERTFLPPETVVMKDDLSGDSIMSVEEPRDWGLEKWDEMRAQLLTGHFDASLFGSA
ncbi:HD-GYP domain-containing protein [Nitrobacter sp.]|uniref:HD-GYP domain-containing protein n=1 Tax=Nitrobacter sp. TaxID=29420 RepID=UPI0029CAC5C7|nr:HD-GYP domain-containing protein [Nitrobacter sp.]